jgi:hypothetical protein
MGYVLVRQICFKRKILQADLNGSGFVIREKYCKRSQNRRSPTEPSVNRNSFKKTVDAIFMATTRFAGIRAVQMPLHSILPGRDILPGVYMWR